VHLANILRQIKSLLFGLQLALVHTDSFFRQRIPRE